MSSAIATPQSPVPDLPPLIGASAAIDLARSRIERFARSNVPVLLVGSTGTGKEVVARHLHALSGRGGELIDVNCGALPREMIESLFFGHRKGAFTGATESACGFIVRAHGGTLFLDELLSLPPAGQAALLRVLETGEVTPLGARVKQRVDFRLVATVQDDVAARIENLQFRPDLYYRISGVTIHLPPLSARAEDIEPLAVHFAGLRGRTLSQGAADVLQHQPWPGNVRELRSVVERAIILADHSIIHAATFLDALRVAEWPARPRAWDARAELIAACITEGGDVSRIAPALGISRATLYRRLREHGLSLRELVEANGRSIAPRRRGPQGGAD